MFMFAGKARSRVRKTMVRPGLIALSGAVTAMVAGVGGAHAQAASASATMTITGQTSAAATVCSWGTATSPGVLALNGLKVGANTVTVAKLQGTVTLTCTNTTGAPIGLQLTSANAGKLQGTLNFGQANPSIATTVPYVITSDTPNGNGYVGGYSGTPAVATPVTLGTFSPTAAATAALTVTLGVAVNNPTVAAGAVANGTSLPAAAVLTDTLTLTASY